MKKLLPVLLTLLILSGLLHSGCSNGSVAANPLTAELYMMNADGTNVVQLTTTGWKEYFDISPDGTKLVYSTPSSGFGSRDDVHVLDVQTRIETNLTNSKNIDVLPCWSAHKTAST
ncbi:MAG: hypothetical protein HN929_04850 [Chloroflexi bacterium]|nr:hypothetical protein [Chloroflexota bacterium]MBT7080781.1 hypothetical protein [Chloroflexota bacterium]MBT7289723.1 hypothetical protein [Chloroflexota bacterium]